VTNVGDHAMTIEAEAVLPIAAPRIARVAASVARVLLGMVLIVMVAINVINAICRYVFGIVFPGADEILVFMMIWLVMLGLILVSAERRNIALDFLATRVGPRTRLVLSVIQHLAMTLACAFATVQCWLFVSRVARIGQTSMALGIPMAIPHFALVVGMAGTTVVAALILAGDIAALAGGPTQKNADRA
jgi:TRAP-type C4-dicarboxylate transport system permease small subunit